MLQSLTFARNKNLFWSAWGVLVGWALFSLSRKKSRVLAKHRGEVDEGGILSESCILTTTLISLFMIPWNHGIF